MFIDEAKPLREKTDQESISRVLELEEQAYPEFLNAATVFKKLQERFRDDPLAGLAGLRSGQNYMRAHQFKDAVRMFTIVDEEETYDGPEIRAQAIYWKGQCFERSPVPLGSDKNNLDTAYKIYRRITFDFPDSKWAKYARGRLADPAFGEIIELEEKTREALLESIKFQKQNRSLQKREKAKAEELLKK
jgi:hypothetical protein